MSRQSQFLVSWLEREFIRLESTPPRMPLTLEQRHALFDGENPPKITYPGDEPCPVEKGHVETLSAHVWLAVVDVRRTSKGDHSLVYELHNENLGSRYPAKQHGQLHPEQYVSSPAGAIDDQAVDDFTQRRFTREAKDRERKAKGELIAAAEEFLSELKKVDTAAARRAYWPVRREVDRLIERERRRVA